jgi:hypothetical protein
MVNVISIIPALINRESDDLDHKLLHLQVALSSVEDLNEIRVHLLAQLDDICKDLGLP